MTTTIPTTAAISTTAAIGPHRRSCRLRSAPVELAGCISLPPECPSAVAPLRCSPGSSPPRRDGSTPSAGAPVAITSPWSRAISRSAIDEINGRSCSITSRLAPISSRSRSNTGANASTSRWAMPLEGSSSSTTVGRWATRQARSTMRRVPVDSSRMNELRYSAEVHQFDQLVDPSCGALLVVEHRREPQRGGDHAALRGPALQRNRDALRNGHLGEQSSVLEAAAEAAAGSRRGRGAADVVAVEHDPSAVGGDVTADQIEQRGLAGAVRADHPDDLALAHRERDVVDGAVAAERTTETGDLEGDVIRPHGGCGNRTGDRTGRRRRCR